MAAWLYNNKGSGCQDRSETISSIHYHETIVLKIPNRRTIVHGDALSIPRHLKVRAESLGLQQLGSLHSGDPWVALRMEARRGRDYGTYLFRSVPWVAYTGNALTGHILAQVSLQVLPGSESAALERLERMSGCSLPKCGATIFAMGGDRHSPKRKDFPTACIMTI